MSRRDQLEAALQADWNLATLAIYADVLQAEADPRGELIAFDLQQHNATGVELDISIAVDFERERMARVSILLGRDLAVKLQRSAVRFGFFHDLRLADGWGNPHENLAKLERTPMWPYVRGLSIWGGKAFVKSAVAAVSDHRHPWLKRLTIEVLRSAPPKSPLVTRAVAADLIDNTPALEVVQIRGQRVFGAFAHPRVTTWTLSHPDSVTR